MTPNALPLARQFRQTALRHLDFQYYSQPLLSDEVVQAALEAIYTRKKAEIAALLAERAQIAERTGIPPALSAFSPYSLTADRDARHDEEIEGSLKGPRSDLFFAASGLFVFGDVEKVQDMIESVPTEYSDYKFLRGLFLLLRAPFGWSAALKNPELLREWLRRHASTFRWNAEEGWYDPPEAP